MRLTRITIEGFRGIRDLQLDFDRDITVLIGENNSGKTSILDAIRFGLDTIKSGKTSNFSEFDFCRDNSVYDISLCKPVILTYIFEESEIHPWGDEIVQALNEIIIGDDYSAIKLRVKGWFDKEEKCMKQEWCFLDNADNEMIGKHNLLKELRKLRPVFFQSALRVAKDEFHGQATFWSSFLNNQDIDNEAREEFEKELDIINNKIVDAHASFKDVIDEVKRLISLVSIGQTGAVSIDPTPANVYKSLRSAQVNLLTDTEAKIPLRSHGEGTQSLSVLLLFNAYLKTRLKIDINELAEPIVAIEEPEAHLHPNAIRALWPLLSALPGQKIVATHSGDILSEVPIEKIRRMSRTQAGIVCYKLPEDALDEQESRKFKYHVHRNRGELLFAKCWLLVEGETDVAVLSACDDILGANLHKYGIRLVEYAQAGGPGLFIKAANALGIKWHVVADNDDSGSKYVGIAKELLNGLEESERITQLAALNMDILLCISGFGEPYKDGVVTVLPPYPDASWDEVLEVMKRTYDQKPGQALKIAKKLRDRSQPQITEEEGTAEYWAQVYKCLRNKFSKPAAALEAILLMKRVGEDGVPTEIRQILQKAIYLSGGAR